MAMFFDNSNITVYRHRRIGMTNRYAMSMTYTGYDADIQPAAADRIQLANGRYGAVFTAYIDATIDIREGDQLQSDDGKRYSVKGIQVWQGAGLLDHKELLLMAMDA
jgi:hypothetical protein